MAEGIAQDLTFEVSGCLEPSAVKSGFDILVSKNGVWELHIKTPSQQGRTLSCIEQKDECLMVIIHHVFLLHQIVRLYWLRMLGFR